MAPLATIAAVVAFVIGQPAPVTCSPNMTLQPGGDTIGLTWFVNGQPFNIELAYFVCAEWRHLQLTKPSGEPESQWLLNAWYAGQAMLVMVHEAEHYRYADTDEALTECRAIRDYAGVLDYVLGPLTKYTTVGIILRATMLQGAYTLDHEMPANYHGGTC